MTPTNRKWSSLMDSSSLVDCDPVKDRMLWKITTGAVKQRKVHNMSFILLAVEPNDLKLERGLCDLKGKSIWCCLTLFSLGLIWSRTKQSYFTLFPIPNLTNIVIHLSSTIKLSFPDLYQLSSETIPIQPRSSGLDAIAAAYLLEGLHTKGFSIYSASLQTAFAKSLAKALTGFYLSILSKN